MLSDLDTIEIMPLPSPMGNSWAFLPLFPAYMNYTAACPWFLAKVCPLPPQSSPLPPLATLILSTSQLSKYTQNESVGTTQPPKYLPGNFRTLNSRRLNVP